MNIQLPYTNKIRLDDLNIIEMYSTLDMFIENINRIPYNNTHSIDASIDWSRSIKGSAYWLHLDQMLSSYYYKVYVFVYNKNVSINAITFTL